MLHILRPSLQASRLPLRCLLVASALLLLWALSVFIPAQYSLRTTSNSRVTVASRQGSSIVRLSIDRSATVYAMDTRTYVPQIPIDTTPIHQVSGFPWGVQALLPAIQIQPAQAVGRLQMPKLSQTFHPAIEVWAVQCPYWVLLGVLSIPGFVGLAMRRRRRIGGRCASCGYDLRATPDRCPECGTEVAGKDRASAPPQGPKSA
jgi:hypothetical protein